MLRIRFQRLGKKKAPTYRLVVSERTKDTHAGSIEILGDYRPVAGDKPMTMKEDRIKYWLSVGAQPSTSVRNLFIKLGFMQGKPHDVVTISKKRQAKLTSKEEAKKAAEEAKKAAEEKKRQEQEAAAQAAKAAAEAPASEEPEAKTEEAPAA